MTQKEIILNYLMKHGSITTLESMKNLLVLDLQKPIQLLRQEGYRITDKWVTTKNKRRYKRYYLERG